MHNETAWMYKVYKPLHTYSTFPNLISVLVFWAATLCGLTCYCYCYYNRMVSHKASHTHQTLSDLLCEDLQIGTNVSVKCWYLPTSTELQPRRPTSASFKMFRRLLSCCYCLLLLQMLLNYF